MTDLLIQILYHITLALKVPVIIGLMIAFVWALYEAGRFLREWLDRARVKKSWNQFLGQIPRKTDDVERLKKDFFELSHYPTLLAMFAGYAKQFDENAGLMEKLVADIEIEANRRCYRMRIGVRVGPILGLMGTLIPMGPALMSISTGNLEAMAQNLIIAFSTTVVGLMIGAMCLVMLIARQHWYAKDMSDIEHLLNTAFFPEGEK